MLNKDQKVNYKTETGKEDENQKSSLAIIQCTAGLESAEGTNHNHHAGKVKWSNDSQQDDKSSDDQSSRMES